MIQFRNVSWRHTNSSPDAHPADRETTLSALTFSVPQGGFRWLLGRSGAGKSSLLRLLHVEALAASGEVELLGTTITRTTKRSVLARLRQRIGMVHQDYRLMPTLSVADNVALPLRLQRRHEIEVLDEVKAILDWVGLGERGAAFPAQLSGGEQQRTALARAVIARPDIVLADEPTNALEEEQANRVINMLREISAMGTTVIVATHNDALVRRFPAPELVLDQGRLVRDE